MTRACAAAAVLLAAAAALTHHPARAAEPTRTVLLRSTAVPLDARSPLTADIAAAPEVLPGGSRVSATQVEAGRHGKQDEPAGRKDDAE